MSDKSGIEWTDATWNPTTGCVKVSAGCKFCYAKHKAWPRLAAMSTGVYTGRKFEDVQVHPERLDQPLRWTKPRMIFVNSMSDLFHEDIPDEFIKRVFSVMAMADQHIFQVLTKRPMRMRDFMREWAAAPHPGRAATSLNGRLFPLTNVWLGVSVENQETADERIPLLLETPAAVRWLSCEPLLGPIDLFHRNLLNWVVVGGESGPKARPMDEGWCRKILADCQEWGVPFLFKQGSQANWPRYRDFESFPTILQVREYPLKPHQDKSSTG